MRRGLKQQLNRALHEARRPLQLLALHRDPPVELAQIADALAAIDAIVNGGTCERCPEPIDLGELVSTTVARLRRSPLAAGRVIDVVDTTGGRAVPANRLRLIAAVENLVINALEHGDGRVRLTVESDGAALVLRVANAVSAIPVRDAENPRHGHGLDVVAEAVAPSRGWFGLADDGTRVIATLALPAEANRAGA